MTWEIYTYSDLIVTIYDRICFERIQDGPFSHCSVFSQTFPERHEEFTWLHKFYLEKKSYLVGYLDRAPEKVHSVASFVSGRSEKYENDLHRICKEWRSVLTCSAKFDENSSWSHKKITNLIESPFPWTQSIVFIFRLIEEEFLRGYLFQRCHFKDELNWRSDLTKGHTSAQVGTGTFFF